MLIEHVHESSKCIHLVFVQHSFKKYITVMSYAAELGHLKELSNPSLVPLKVGGNEKLGGSRRRQ